MDRAAFEMLMYGYYRERGWDAETSLPTPTKPDAFGLSFVVRDWERASVLQR